MEVKSRIVAGKYFMLKNSEHYEQMSDSLY